MTTVSTPSAAKVWRVLVIDDSPDDRAEVRRLLLNGSERRYQFAEAETAAAGVRAALDAAAGPPDCVVLDYTLPDGDALEVLAALVGPDGLTACPVVVLTGTAGHEQTRAVIRAGAQDYIGKGWTTPESLTRAVENATERWAMAHELSDREAALRASEERLRLAVEASATGLWTWHLDTDAVTWSAECYPIHGVADGAFDGTGAAFFRLVHPDDRGRVEATVRAAVADRALYECEFRVVRPDGTAAWVANRGRYSYDPAGRPLQVLGTITDISDRKRSDEQLRRNADSFHQLVQNNPFGVYVVDADFRLRQTSVGAQKAFASVHPLSGRDFAEVVRLVWPEPFAAEVIGRFRHTLATGEPYIATSTDERRRDIEETEAYDWRIERVTLPDGRDGVVCYFYDLSERQRWVAALAARERELQSLADNTPDILTRFDRDLRHVFINAAMETATGRPRAELLGKTNRELDMPPDLCDLWETATRSVFDHGRHKSIEFTFPSPDGPRHYAARLVPEFAADGTVEFVLGVTHDITERTRVEETLRESEARLGGILRRSPAGIVQTDAAGRMTLVNPRWCEMLGYPEAELLGRGILEITHPSFEDETAAAFGRLAAGGPDFQIEKAYCRKDVSVLRAQSNVAAVRSPDGVFLGLIAVVLDISERLRTEEELRRLAAELSEADRRKDEFLATLAHELRNPLAPIRNGLAVLQKTRSPEQTEKVVGMMDRQLGHLVNLVDDLLDLSRVRTGKITLRVERVTVREAVDAAVEACRPTIDEKSHTLDVDLAAESLAVIGDKTRLVQVVANLLTNAAKYSEPGGRIRVVVGRDGGEAVVRVSDTGLGIAPETIPTLWDLFTQVRDTLDKAQGGLGIGLSLVKKLVEMHGGSVAAESAGVGHGSTFTVRLPLAAATEPTVETSPHRNGTATTRPAGRRVLVVDDNVDGAESLAMLLQISGHKTATAHTGAAALKTARTFTPDVVFLDIGLPAGMDGYEVARRLRADPETAEAVLVALTGWGSEDDKRKSREAGFDWHLTKPVELDAVQGILSRFTALTTGGRR